MFTLLIIRTGIRFQFKITMTHLRSGKKYASLRLKKIAKHQHFDFDAELKCVKL